MEGPMQHAVREAGIAMPHNKRIWLWLKDKAPTPQTASAIAAALKITVNSVSSLCSDMEDRGMLTRTEETMRLAAGPGGRGVVMRKVAHYTVNTKMGNVFELLPKPRKEKTDTKTDAVIKQYSVPFAAVLPPAPAPEVKKEFSPEEFVEKLSLKQSKELHIYLRGIFEGR